MPLQNFIALVLISLHDFQAILELSTITSPPRCNALVASSHLEDITAHDLDLLSRSVATSRRHASQPIHDRHAVPLKHDVSKHGMLAIEMRCWAERDEELRTIRAWPAVGHAQGSLVLVSKRRHELVLEFGAVDAGASAAGTRWVTALDHEALDDAVEDDVVVLAGCGEGGEILAGLCHARQLSRSCDDETAAYLWGLFLEQCNGDVANGGMKGHAGGIAAVTSAPGRLRRRC